jgi:hypothetical protein
VFISANTLSDAMARTPDALWLCFSPDSPFSMERGSPARARRCRSIHLFDLVARVDPEIRRAGTRDVVYMPFAADSCISRERARSNVQHSVTFVAATTPHAQNS